MVKQVCIFEDEKWGNFAPLTLTRPVYELVTGMTSLRAKIARAFPGADLCLLTRDYLAPKLRRLAGDIPVNDPDVLTRGDTLYVNGRALTAAEVSQAPVAPGQLYLLADQVVGAYLGPEQSEPIRQAVGQPLDASVWNAVSAKVERVEVPAGMVTLLDQLWEVVLANGEWIRHEFPLFARGGGGGVLEEGVFVRGDRGNLYVGPGTVVQSGVVLDVTEGPIFLSENVTIKPPTLVQGPSFVGRNTLLDGAKIREDTTLGPVCKVGGEVEASIIHSYSNKHHDGFLGHAYVGEWVNLGALVTNSDLQNNYKPVKVQRWADEPVMNSGETFVGCSIGDHTKLGIGVMITTGATIGMCVNWTGKDIVPAYTPSFVWHTPAKHLEYRLDKAVETATAVMARRKVEFDQVEMDLMTRVFELTAADRRAALEAAQG